MAGIWGLCIHWGLAWYSIFQDKGLVYIHIISYHGLAPYYLYDTCFLAEHKKIYVECKAQSIKTPVIQPCDL